MYIYEYIYIYIQVCLYVYIYIYIDMKLKHTLKIVLCKNSPNEEIHDDDALL